MTYVISPFFWGDMESKSMEVRLADLPFGYSFVNDRVQMVFAGFITDKDEKIVERLSMTESEIQEAVDIYEEGSSIEYVEFMELSMRTADALLKYKRCLFHGVAFIFRGRAYIFTAPSGTGKSTQYFLWKLLYKDEIQIINGDKPILDFSAENGVIMVYPSPWQGKEGMGSMECAPLGGIIYLRQGSDNMIRRLKTKEAILPIFSQFICSEDTKEQIQMMGRLEDQLLKAVPVWLLTNCGDESSARLCYDTIVQEVEKGHEI